MPEQVHVLPVAVPQHGRVAGVRPMGVQIAQQVPQDVRRLSRSRRAHRMGTLPDAPIAAEAGQAGGRPAHDHAPRPVPAFESGVQVRTRGGQLPGLAQQPGRTAHGHIRRGLPPVHVHVQVRRLLRDAQLAGEMLGQPVGADGRGGPGRAEPALLVQVDHRGRRRRPATEARPAGSSQEWLHRVCSSLLSMPQYTEYASPRGLWNRCTYERTSPIAISPAVLSPLR